MKSTISLRHRPKTDYIHKAELGELHTLTEHWIKDLEFYLDEIHFFFHLVDKYFTLLLKEQHINEAQVVVTNIHAMEKNLKLIRERSQKHLIWIDCSYELDEVPDEESFRKEHEELEDDMSDFLARFAQVKKDVFSLSRNMIEVEKLNHLLTS